MNFEFLNNIPDSAWRMGVDGQLRMAFPIADLCRHLGIEVSPEWGIKFDFLGTGQPRCYRHWPSARSSHTELTCLPTEKAAPIDPPR